MPGHTFTSLNSFMETRNNKRMFTIVVSLLSHITERNGVKLVKILKIGVSGQSMYYKQL